jgi:hypothetical protein
MVVRLSVRHKVVSYRKKAALAQSPSLICTVALTYYIAYSPLNKLLDLPGKVLPRAALEASCILLTGYPAYSAILLRNVSAATIFSTRLIFIDNSGHLPRANSLFRTYESVGISSDGGDTAEIQLYSGTAIMLDIFLKC